MSQPAPDLRSRLALTLGEAAACLGVSESTIRRLLPVLGNAVIRVGRSPRVSVRGLEEWLEGQRKAQAVEAGAPRGSAIRDDANQMLDSLD